MPEPRPAQPADVPAILQLIHELAVYEKEPDAVKNTEVELQHTSSAPTPGLRTRD